ncbi:cytochrome P450 [Rhodococcus koreensis]
MTATVEDLTMSIPDLSDPRTFVDKVPHDVFDEIRTRPGFHWQPTDVGTLNGGFWAVTRYADVVEIEQDPLTFSSRRGTAYPSLTTMPLTQENNPSFDMLMAMDPPRHSSIRRVAAKAFGPRMVANFGVWVNEIVDETLTRVEDLDAFDLIDELAATIPSLVIARIMGIPRKDRMKIVEWTNESFRLLQQGDAGRPRIREISAEQAEYIRADLWDQRLRDPQEDMTTVLAHASERGELTRSEADQFLTLLIGAGFETTHTLIGQAMRMILEEPQVREDMLKAIPEVGVDRVIDEFLRMISPPMNMGRTAMADVEICGQNVKKDDLLLLYFTAANRDPAFFNDPHRFNPWRTEGPALAFGSGPHRCLGAALAKLELRVLFEQLSARGIKLRLNGEPKRGWSVFINQLTSLPVARVR